MKIKKNKLIIISCTLLIFLLIILTLILIKKDQVIDTEFNNHKEVSDHYTGGSFGIKKDPTLQGTYELHIRGLSNEQINFLSNKVVNHIKSLSKDIKTIFIQKKSIQTFWHKKNKNIYCYQFNVSYNDKDHINITIERPLLEEKLNIIFN